MKIATFIGTLVLLTSINAAVENEELYGMWHLVSFTQTIIATGETTTFLEKHHGLLMAVTAA
jgi:hypothetical protein